MDKLTDALITYGQVSQALTNLGFTRTDTAEYIAFCNTAHDALLALPLNPPEQRMDGAFVCRALNGHRQRRRLGEHAEPSSGAGGIRRKRVGRRKAAAQ